MKRILVRMILCAALAALALTLAVFTLAGFARDRGAPPPGSLYVLREAGGNVAVYGARDLNRPLAITEIELESLREGDRAMIAGGLPVYSREELAQLLEDLGS